MYMSDEAENPTEETVYANVRARAETAHKLRILASIANESMLDTLEVIIDEAFQERFAEFSRSIGDGQG